MSLEKVSYQKLNEEIGKVENKIGDLSNLPTTDKSSVVASMSEVFQNVSSGKTSIASAITDKGVTTSSDATFSQMATNILNIPSGGGQTVNAKCFTKTFSSDQTGIVEFNSGDSEIAAHINENTLVVGFIATFSVSTRSLRASFVGANSLHGVNNAYGIYFRSSSSGLAGVVVQKLAKDPPNTTVGTMSVDSNGVISVYANSEYPLKTGTYIVIVGW